MKRRTIKKRWARKLCLKRKLYVHCAGYVTCDGRVCREVILEYGVGMLRALWREESWPV